MSSWRFYVSPRQRAYVTDRNALLKIMQNYTLNRSLWQNNYKCHVFQITTKLQLQREVKTVD
jgi:hypothetical protein